MLASLSACEFGNKVKIEQSGYDLISGYYASLPQSIEFRAAIGTAPERTRNGTVAEMPDFLKVVMRNPTALNYVNPVKGVAAIQSRENPNAYFLTLVNDKAGTFGASTSGKAVLADCEFREEIVNSGSFSQLATTQEIAGVTARGKIALDYQLTYSLHGLESDCQAIRNDMHDCYVLGTNCSSDPNSIFSSDFVHSVFDPFVATGIMTGNEIVDFRSVTYRGKYE